MPEGLFYKRQWCLPASRSYSPGWALASSTASLHLVLGFWTKLFFIGWGWLAPCPTPILENQGVSLSLDFTLWPYQHEWPCWYLNYCRHCSLGHRVAQALPPRQGGDTFGGKRHWYCRYIGCLAAWLVPSILICKTFVLKRLNEFNENTKLEMWNLI
jgi:hypothetical protein